MMRSILVMSSGQAGAAGVLAMLITLMLAANARAGTYTIYDCPSVGSNSAGPWQITGGNEQKTTCSAGYGDFIGPLQGTMSPNSAFSMSVYAPSGLTLAAATVYWYVPHQSSGADMFAEAWSSSDHLLESGTPYDARYTPASYTLPAGTTSLALEAYCSSDDYGNGCEFPSSQTPEIQMFGSAIAVSDNTPPTGSVTGGALAGSGPFSGSQSIAYSASDGLSGIYSVALEIDGKPVATNSYRGECPYTTFLACPASQSGSLTWNTASVAPGPHEVALSIENAAGDTTVVDDHAVTIANQPTQTSSGTVTGNGSVIGPGSPSAARGAPNGTNASDQAELTARWAKTAKATLADHYGKRERVTGTLTTTSGQPITGASLNVYATPAYQGAQPQSLGSVQTGTTGAWTLTLPANIPSSTLSFAYRSHVNDTVPVAAATLELDVHAGLTLHIAPHTTSVGRKIFFSGVLHGAPIPLGGKQLVLEASSGGEWIEFDTLTTNSKGRYHASYRFKFPGPVTYRFRVTCPHEADFPFLDGASNSVAVHEL